MSGGQSARPEQNGQLHDAFVLHTRPFRNSSQIIDLLSLSMGRISLIARGSS
ncbi:MAG TPA: DNA repair protein RecO, partial [Gammaproteobacteria bacterium]|nr:DNA repair protein RecO [Gammaproteobacteria bacterium]